MPSLLGRALSAGDTRKLRAFEKRVARIGAFEPELELETDEELRGRMDGLRERAANGESLEALLEECFAVVRETSRRMLGMRHFDVQLIGAMALHDGCIAEMKTGEGKTLTATLAVVLNSLAVRTDANGDRRSERNGVHVVTVNDYLARRDAEWMSPVYEALGVSVGVLGDGQPEDEKQRAYSCDVVYGTNSEFGFDYLRDNMAIERSEKVQRGHPFAIVDEIDNILIDEARTPLIISGEGEEGAAELQLRLAELAREMTSCIYTEGQDSRPLEVDYEFDEKRKTVSITEQGVATAERYLGIDHLYRAENGHLVNHLIQALRAESLYERDVDYAVIDGEVKIIDEFTGRVLDDQRWSEGLHQAVEAKEGVEIQEEETIEATITYQNYFRIYQKLAGMTGTALTESTEFMKTYRLAVLQVPTNVPAIRVDLDDQVYKTMDGKWNAVVEEIAGRHGNGQPVLVGTASVKASESLSARLEKIGVDHTVLNAKPEHAAREAEIIAEAGQPGAVTIATNMAGRGVDIKLGGNAEHLARLELAKQGVTPEDGGYEQRFAEVLTSAQQRVAEDRERVIAAGGLFICGTERHESRRIDDQLRGRSGRQGDPGESRFLISADDDLVRLFADDRIFKALDKLGDSGDGEEKPLRDSSVIKEIQAAQEKVEKEHFLERRYTLEYDDVLSEQRRVIYAYRDEILEGTDLSEKVRTQIEDLISSTLEEHAYSDHTEGPDGGRPLEELLELLPLELDARDVQRIDPAMLGEEIMGSTIELYEARERALGEQQMRDLERELLLQIIDEHWREHLSDMDYLQEGIHLRTYGEEDPLVAYKNEAYGLFCDLIDGVWADFTANILTVDP